MNDDNIIVSCISGKYIVGTNETNVLGNAVADKSKLPKKIVVPFTLNGHDIEEIGCYAFTGISCIEEVEIGNGIKIIRTYAFGDCWNLISVRVPESVEFIGTAGFHTYNYSSAGSSLGKLIISFSPNSRLNFLDSRAIGRKEHTIIYFWDKCTSVKYNDDPFFKSTAKSIIAYAPKCSYFGGIKTKQLNTCFCRRSHVNEALFLTLQLIC